MTATTTTPGLCGCGCGQERNPARQFAPGHDAKLVAKLVQRTIEDDNITFLDKTDIRDWDIQDRINHIGNVVETRFSKALAVKYTNAAMNAWAKANKEHKPIVAEPTALDFVRGTVKVGRWDYPAVRYDDGAIQYSKTRTPGPDFAGHCWVNADEKIAATFRTN